MKNFQKPISLLALAAVSLLAACSKTPPRPDPSATVLSYPGNNNLTPEPLSTLAPGTNLEVRDPNIIEDANTIRGLLGAVYYDYDSSVIKAEERAKLQKAADYLKQNPQYRLLLEGHCDWRGTDEYNLGLGDRRATAAKSYLTSIGVAGGTVTARAQLMPPEGLSIISDIDDTVKAVGSGIEIGAPEAERLAMASLGHMTLHDLQHLFPPLSTISCDGPDEVALVNQCIVEELMQDLCRLDFGRRTHATASRTATAGQPLFAFMVAHAQIQCG